MVGYFIKSLIENLSKYTTLFGKNLEFVDDAQMQGSDFSTTDMGDMRTENCNDEFSSVNLYGTDIMCDGVTPINTDENNMIM